MRLAQKIVNEHWPELHAVVRILAKRKLTGYTPGRRLVVTFENPDEARAALGLVDMIRGKLEQAGTHATQLEFDIMGKPVQGGEQ